jgi:ribosome-associated protein
MILKKPIKKSAAKKVATKKVAKKKAAPKKAVAVKKPAASKKAAASKKIGTKKVAAKKAVAKKKVAAKKVAAKKVVAKKVAPKKVVAKKVAAKKVVAKKVVAKKVAPKKAAPKKVAKRTVVAAPVARPSYPDYVENVLKQLDDSKAEEIITINLENKSTMADWMVVASGRSDRHVNAIAQHVVEHMHKQGKKNVRVEGMPQCDWVLVDTGDIIVHVFRPEVRSFYNLEKLWSDARP